MENIPYEECLDTRGYETEQEKYDLIIKSTKEFDWLSFYNSGKNLNALIVITPEQTIILTPIYRHAYAMDFIYKMLYDLSVENPNINIDKITNNVTIRLVAGESIQVQSFYPEKITEYQKEELDRLILDLQSKKDSIEFTNFFDQMIFQETYEDTMRKYENIEVVDKLEKEIKKDKFILEDKKQVIR